MPVHDQWDLKLSFENVTFEDIPSDDELNPEQSFELEYESQMIETSAEEDVDSADYQDWNRVMHSTNGNMETPEGKQEVDPKLVKRPNNRNQQKKKDPRRGPPKLAKNRKQWEAKVISEAVQNLDAQTKGAQDAAKDLSKATAEVVADAAAVGPGVPAEPKLNKYEKIQAEKADMMNALPFEAEVHARAPEFTIDLKLEEPSQVNLTGSFLLLVSFFLSIYYNLKFSFDLPAKSGEPVNITVWLWMFIISAFLHRLRGALKNYVTGHDRTVYSVESMLNYDLTHDYRSDIMGTADVKHRNAELALMKLEKYGRIHVYLFGFCIYTKTKFVQREDGTEEKWLFGVSLELLSQLNNPKLLNTLDDRKTVKSNLDYAARNFQSVNIPRWLTFEKPEWRFVVQNTVHLALALYDEQTILTHVEKGEKVSVNQKDFLLPPAGVSAICMDTVSVKSSYLSLSPLRIMSGLVQLDRSILAAVHLYKSLLMVSFLVLPYLTQIHMMLRQ